MRFFCNNDVLAGNVHNCDIHTIIPLFWEGELVSWIAGVTHVPDVGARTPGSSPVGPMSTYDQGLTIPPQKIGEDDEVYRSFKDTYKRTSRTPLHLELDEKTRLRIRKLNAEEAFGVRLQPQRQGVS